MIIEHLQMMSVALDHYGYPPAKKKDGSYYSTKAYKNHPCTKWVKESSSNFMWLYMMTYHLCREFHIRYGKAQAGRNSILLMNDPSDSTITRVMEENVFPHVGYTMQPQAMPAFCKVEGDVLQAYRNYYNWTKWKFATWKTQPPKWWAPSCYLVAKGEY
jgi:hypothetical protein